MFGFLARLASGAVSPLVERVSASAATLARKLALFALAGVCFLVALVALTVAFDLWIASMAGAIVGALAVAGVYALVGVLAVVGATRGGRRSPAQAPQEAAAAKAEAERGEEIDRFTAPLLGVLASLGLRREQLAVFAGAAMAKRLKPLPLVGLAILAGFLVGRLWKGVDALASNDLVATLLGLLGVSQDGRSGRAEDQAA